MALDHKEQLEKKRPRNPTSSDAFAEGRWKTFSKVRDSLIEKVSGKKGGHLNDSDPRIWYKQIEVLEMEIEGQGWDLQGPEICRALWDLLPLDWRIVLKETKAYKALLKEDFKDTEAQVITSRYTGLVTAIYDNFGNQGMHVYGTSITMTYKQREDPIQLFQGHGPSLGHLAGSDASRVCKKVRGGPVRRRPQDWQRAHRRAMDREGQLGGLHCEAVESGRGNRPQGY